MKPMETTQGGAKRERERERHNTNLDEQRHSATMLQSLYNTNMNGPDFSLHTDHLTRVVLRSQHAGF